MDAEQRCPIWGTAANVQSGGMEDVLYVDSPRAGGKYVVTGTAAAMLRHADPQTIDPETRAKLTTWLVDQRRLGDAEPLVDSSSIERAKNAARLPIIERVYRLLELFARHTKVIGAAVKPDSNFANLIGAWTEAESPQQIELNQEIAPLYKYLMDRKLIERSNEIRGPDYTVTVEGLSLLEDRRKTSVASDQAFVAMWFDSSMNDAYDRGLAPGIEDAGYRPLRIDRTEHNDRIDDRIIAEIRRSRFLVADFTQGDTGARGGVYYEAGFAHGLNIPVIFTCRQESIEKVHFDTRQYNHIVWTDANDLREKLKNRILATIGEGPAAKRR